MTLAGRNGAGKTTLLRMLAGETPIDGGELVLAKGTRVALHDQRPPASATLTLRDYVLSGCGDLVALEARPRGSSRARWASGPTTRRCSTATRAPRRGWSTPADGTGASARSGPCTASGSPTGPGPPPRRLLRRGAHPRVARPRAGGGSGPAAPGRAHQPPGHRLARVARGLPREPGRGRGAGGPRPLVPRGRGHLGAGDGGGAHALLPRLLARLAQGERRPRDAARPGDREAAGRDRAHGALHRALPCQGDEGAPGAVAREGDRPHGDGHARSARHAHARLRVRLGRAQRAGGARGRGRPPRGAAGARCSTTASCGWSGESTSRSWGPTARERPPWSRRSPATASSTAAASGAATT